jgi:hypothetical protein
MLIAYNHFRRVLQSETLLPWLWLNFPTLLWVMVLIAKISNLTLSHVPTYSWGEIIASTLIVASVLLLHGALSRVRARYRFVIVAPVLLVLLIHLTAGFPAFGGLVLRQVGIGGGMPIDYMSRQTGPEPQHGCLVLMTSMYYFIQPFPPNKPCPTLVSRFGSSSY